MSLRDKVGPLTTATYLALIAMWPARYIADPWLRRGAVAFVVLCGAVGIYCLQHYSDPWQRLADLLERQWRRQRKGRR